MLEFFEILKMKNYFGISAYFSNDPNMDDRIEYTLGTTEEHL